MSNGAEKDQLRDAMLEYCKLDTYAMVRIFEKIEQVWLTVRPEADLNRNVICRTASFDLQTFISHGNFEHRWSRCYKSCEIFWQMYR